MKSSGPIFLALGGNVGNVIETFHTAFSQFNQHAIHTCKVSHIYQTHAWNSEHIQTDDPDFYNLVCEVSCQESPLRLLEKLKNIENLCGRTRTHAAAPRTLDIDILCYGTNILSLPELQLPHPRLHLRPFVLQPWSEIANNFLVPRYDKTVGVLKNELQNPYLGIVKIVASYKLGNPCSM